MNKSGATRSNNAKTRTPMTALRMELVKNLRYNDARLECFLNFVPPPVYLKKDGYFASKCKSKILVGGNKCISGSTMIYDPVLKKERRVSEIDSDFHVLAWNGIELVRAACSRPFVKGFGQMLDVAFSNGRTLRCTADHLLLTPEGEYVSLRQRLPAFSLCPQESTWDTAPSVPFSDAQDSTRKVPDFLSYYPSYPHSCDEQPRPFSISCPNGTPSLADVPQRSCATSALCNMDVPDNKVSHNPERLRVVLPSIPDVSRPAQGRFSTTKEYRSFSKDELLNDIRNHTFSQYDPRGCRPRQPSSLCPQNISPSDNLAYPISFSLDAISSTVGIITSIVPVGQEEIWDISVEKYHNYMAAGVINHNSYKTSIAILEDVMIFTGIVPYALRGVYAYEKDLQDMIMGETRRPRHVKIIIPNYSKTWPEVIQPMLLGDPETGGRGFLPEAWAANYDDDKHIFFGPDGSWLSITAVDPSEKFDSNVLRGPLIDHTHICERNVQGAYSESMTRAVGLLNGPKDVTVEFCPQDGYEDWTYRELYLQGYDATTNEPLPEHKKNPSIFVQRVTMRDNPDMSEKEIQDIERSIPAYQVAFRVHGMYSNMASNPYFNMDMLQDWYKSKVFSDGKTLIITPDKAEPDTGIFIGSPYFCKEHEFDETKTPVWRVWEPPESGCKYLLSADTAMGNPDSDYQVADVLKLIDFKRFTGFLQVAQLRMRGIKPGDFAVQCALMGHYYGDCMLVPETNTESGGIFIDRIRNYSSVYVRQSPVTKKNEKAVDKLGWHSDRFSKPIALETIYKTLQQCYAVGYCPIQSEFTIAELMGYEERVVRDKIGDYMKTEWGNRPGVNDDTVMSLAIGNRVLVKENYKLSTCIVKGDMIENRYISKLERDANIGSPKRYSGAKKQFSTIQLRNMLYGNK